MVARHHILSAKQLDEASCDKQVNTKGIYWKLYKILKKHVPFGSLGCIKRRVYLERFSGSKDLYKRSTGNWPSPASAGIVGSHDLYYRKRT